MAYPYDRPGGYEEALNRQVAGHLYYSLREGPALLDAALGDVGLSFGEEASLVATQDDPLSRNADTEIDREIDWVVRDAEKIVGFESKYGASLTASQLGDELAKLRANADGRSVHLVALTHHATEPSVVDEFDDDTVHWTNWVSVAASLDRLDETALPAAQRVPYRQLRDLFEVEEMDPFSGFDHTDKDQYRYFVRDLRPVVNRIDLENRGNLDNWTQDSTSPSGYTRIVPKYISMPLVHEDRPPLNTDGRPQSKRASTFRAVVDTESHEVCAGIVFGFKKVPAHRKMLREQAADVVAECHDAGYELWIGRHSINHRTVPVERTADRDEMLDWLSSTGRPVLSDPDVDNSYRKLWFLRPCSGEDPETLFAAIVDTLADQKRRFLDRDEFVDLPTLVDPETV